MRKRLSIKIIYCAKNVHFLCSDLLNPDKEEEVLGKGWMALIGAGRRFWTRQLDNAASAANAILITTGTIPIPSIKKSNARAARVDELSSEKILYVPAQ